MQRGRRAVLGGGAVSLFLLMIGANLPLEGGPGVPRSVTLLLTTLLAATLALFLYRGRPDERLASGFVLVAMIRILAIDGLLDAELPADVSSRLSGTLSSTYSDVPLVGLFLAWSILAAGFITTRALTRLAAAEGATGRAVRMSSFGMGILVVSFGMRALIGYVTGSTHLFAQAS